jgi:Predicted DNA binding protein
VESVTCIVAREQECLLEVVLGESLLVTLTEYGAALRSVTAEDGSTRITVELPYEAEARDLFDLVAEEYPGTELLGYHERERPVETRQDFTGAISDRLTDRQETALRTAYLGGFFDWPRGVDGNELAEAMDISRPTYHQHLRAAQEKVFSELFQ